MIKMKIGQRLATERELRKISQAEMADLLSVAPAIYSRIERGETSVDIEDVLKFSKKLNVPIQEFLPETISINNTNNDGNGHIELIIGDINHYSDKESLRTIELKDQELTFLKRENQLLHDKIQHLEELLLFYKQPKATQNEENDIADLTDEQKEILKSRHKAMKANLERRITWEEAKSKLLNS
jgi:transcriptional regulator with XRE-family HTH domain